MDFGARLRELRIQAKMTQAQLAQRIGVTKSVISFYELHERTPSPDVLIRLSGIFHVSTDYLLGLKKSDSIDTSGLSADDILLLRSIAAHLRAKTENNVFECNCKKR